MCIPGAIFEYEENEEMGFNKVHLPEIQNLKEEGKWKDVSHLGYVLRNSWWGYKRFK